MKYISVFHFSIVATVDVKKYIYHLGCNRFDTQIAVVENSGQFEDVEETAVRIYDVGRSKDDDDEAVSVYFQIYEYSASKKI